MNLLHVWSPSVPEIARWLTGLGVALPPGTGRLPTRADVRRAVDSLPAAKVERIETELEEATLIHAYGESASLYVSLSRPGGVYFERFPCEIVAPVMEALVRPADRWSSSVATTSRSS